MTASEIRYRFFFADIYSYGLRFCPLWFRCWAFHRCCHTPCGGFRIGRATSTGKPKYGIGISVSENMPKHTDTVFCIFVFILGVSGCGMDYFLYSIYIYIYIYIFVNRSAASPPALVETSTGHVTTPAMEASKLKTNAEAAPRWVSGWVAVQFRLYSLRAGVRRYLLPRQGSWDELVCRICSSSGRDTSRRQKQTPCFGRKGPVETAPPL